jgi:hypothetical protein
MNPQLLQVLIPLVIIVPVFLLRARRLGRKQPLKLGRLWLRPAILLVACVAALLVPQPGMPLRSFAGLDWALLALAMLAGAAGGWQLGRTMAIDVHPETGTLMVQSSPVGLMVLLGLVLVRMGLRTGVRMEAEAWHLNAALIIDMLIVFTAALFVTRSLEMYLRARRVMADTGNPPIA